MNWLLDTNVVSELTRETPSAAVLAWLQARRGGCYLSTITLAELRYGVERLTDSRRKRELHQEFQFLLEDYQGRFFDLDGNVAAEWGRYAAELEKHYGKGWYEQFDYRDTMLAATAREYGLGLATRNTKHFPFCPIVENPFET
jgi:predicted nucleic acid-binding protein